MCIIKSPMLNKMCAQNNTTSVRSLSLDILRILACMAVITIHTPSLGHIEHLAEVGTSAWMKYIIPLSLSKWSVPVFMMLTGAFLIDPNRPFSYARLYRWRIPHILVVLVVWSLFYMGIVDHCFHYCTLTDQHHFWYLGMLVGLYLIIPMLRALVRDHKAIRCFCYTWLIYMVYDWIGNFFTLPIELIDNIFVDSIGYAAWGYYLTTIQWETANKSLCIWGGAFALVVSPILWILFPKYGSVIANYHSPITAVAAFGLFVCFYTHPIANNTKLAKFICSISELTLGIYMLHAFIVSHVFSRVLRFVVDPLASVLISVLLTFTISAILIYPIRKIPYIGKWLV